MKKVLVTVTVVAVMAFGAIASAHMWGNSGGYGMGHGMGPGYGMGYGMGPGYGMGYGMRGWGAETEEAKKFFSETEDLRKEMHEKRFAYNEALRAGNEDEAKKLYDEMGGIYEKIQKQFPADSVKGTRGFGPGNCGGPYGFNR